MVKLDTTTFDAWLGLEELTPETYPERSFEVSLALGGPVFPQRAFDNVELLTSWYETLLKCWTRDCFRPIGISLSICPTDVGFEISRPEPFVESHKVGIRQLQEQLFRGLNGEHVSGRDEFAAWCNLFHMAVHDDEVKVLDRHSLNFAQDDVLKEILKKAGTDKIRPALNGKMSFQPDEPGILKLWAAIAKASRLPRLDATIEASNVASWQQ